jgi:predicted DNA-binding transcriptional regulator AlpA
MTKILDAKLNGQTGAAAADGQATGAVTDGKPETDVMRELREMKAMLQTLLAERVEPQPDYLDAKTLAKRLGISVTTLYRQVAGEELPEPEKFGSSSRWKWAEVEEAIARRK